MKKIVHILLFSIILLSYCLPCSAETLYAERIDVLDEFIGTLSEEQQKLFTDDFILELVKTCSENELNVWFVLGVMQAESSFNADARAYDGSNHYGLMQLSTKYFELEDYFDPVENMQKGCEYIKSLWEETKNYRCITKQNFEYAHELFVTTAYNKGLGNAIDIWKAEDFCYETGITDYSKKIIQFMKNKEKKFGKINCKEILESQKKIYKISKYCKFL